MHTHTYTHGLVEIFFSDMHLVFHIIDDLVEIFSVKVLKMSKHMKQTVWLNGLHTRTRKVLQYDWTV